MSDKSDKWPDAGEPDPVEYQFPEKRCVHVVPVGGNEPLHVISDLCWCHPLCEVDPNIITHNAKDTRERFERQGIKNPKLPWVCVIEDLL